MTALLRAALFAALAAASIPVVAAGQDPSTASLIRRIDLLERKAADLEQRVRQLEALIKVEPSGPVPVPDSRKWQDIANWRRLQRGMRMDEVRALLGEPARVDAGGWGVTDWYWADEAKVYFVDGKLGGWSEPRR